MKLTVLAAILVISFAQSDARLRQAKKLLEGLAELALPGAFWLKTADLINNFYGGPFGYANALKSDLNAKLSGLSTFDLTGHALLPFSSKFAKFGLSSSHGHWPAETEDWPCETTENWPAASEAATDNHHGNYHGNHHGLELNAQIDLGHAAPQSAHHIDLHNTGSALHTLQAAHSSVHHVAQHHTGSNDVHSVLHRLQDRLRASESVQSVSSQPSNDQVAQSIARLTASRQTTNHHAANHHAGSNVDLLASLTRLIDAQRHH